MLVPFGMSQCVSVQFVVQDANGQTFNNGTYTWQFQANYAVPGPYLFQGANFTQNVAGTLASNGSATSCLTPNTGGTFSTLGITPSGSTWQLTACPNASVACSTFQYYLPDNTTNTVTFTAPAINVPPLVASPRAYADSEVTPQGIGSSYFNTTSNTTRTWNGSAFVNPSVDLASPGPIGATTPAAATFTTVAVGTTVSAQKFGLGASPLTADDTCASGNYWIAPVLGSVNTWRKCENGTLSGFGAAFTPSATTISAVLGGTGGGTANAQTVTLPTAITTYATTNGPGVIVTWKPSVANTGATTLNVSGVGAVNLTKCGTTALVSDDLTTTANAWAQYDGTEFQLFNPQAGICGTSNPTSNFSFSNGIQTNVVSDGSNWSLNNNLTGLAFNMTDGLSWSSNSLFYSGAVDTGFYRMNPGVASVTQGRQQAGSSGGTLQTSQVATAESVIAPVSSPTTGTLTTAATGGTLNSSTTYYYRVSSIDATAAGNCSTPFTGQSTASTEVSTATASGANTATVTIPWTVVPNASGYCVYGRTTGAEQLIAMITSGATATYTDTGSATPYGSPPTINKTGFIKSSATQTTVSCSTSGTAVFSEPYAGASDKKVLINLASCNGTATYTFPVAYTTSPGVFTSSTVSSVLVSSLSNTAVTITGTTSVGMIIIEGY